MLLFAQAVPPAAPGGPPPNMMPWVAGFAGFMCVFFLVLLVIGIFFLRTLSRALERCHPENRAMSPGSVWLNLIPCFNIIWQFVTVIRVGDSLKTEFVERRLDEGGDYGKTLGLAAILLGLFGGVIQNAPRVAAPNDPQMALVASGIGGLISMAQLALSVFYWVKIAGYSRQLADDDEEHAGADDRYDDDRPRRRPDPEDEYDDPR
jgi:hypothetical protein